MVLAQTVLSSPTSLASPTESTQFSGRGQGAQWWAGAPSMARVLGLQS